MSSYAKVECPSCTKGIAMCHQRPCWGTVSDLERIIEEGHADKLMLDYYNHKDLNNREDVYFLSGANCGCEKQLAKLLPIGPCTFLSEDKCTIHDIKPTLGAVACCKDPHSLTTKVIFHCMESWIRKEGAELISRWKEMVGYDEENVNEMVNALFR